MRLPAHRPTCGTLPFLHNVWLLGFESTDIEAQKDGQNLPLCVPKVIELVRAEHGLVRRALSLGSDKPG